MLARWWYGPKTAGQLWHKDRHVASYDGTEIRYTLIGPPDVRKDAPVVALCAGFVCPDTYWRYLVPALRDDYRVLVWNYRGMGVSGLPRNPGYHAYAIKDEELSIEANARDLFAVLDDAGIDHAVLAGHSMGVQVILEAYRQEPGRIDALIALAGPYRTPLRTFYGTDLAARVAPVALPLMHALPRASLLLWRAIVNNTLTYPAAVHVAKAVGPRAKAVDMAGYFEYVSLLDPLLLAKMIRGMHNNDASDLLPNVKVPVLIVHGTKDPFTPLVVAEEMAAAIPDATLVVIENAAHTMPIEYPAEVAGEVRTFLQRVLTS